MGLKQRVLKGVSWNIIDQIARQIISLIVTAILARILNPDDYGLVALSAIFIGFISLFENLSAGVAVIQKSDIDTNYISTVFWTSAITGVVLTIILCATAPLVASYYNKPILTYIIIISSLNFIVNSVYSTHKSLIAKKLEFHKIAAINVGLGLITAIASLILAVLGFGVWSLVYAGVIANLFIIPLVWHLEKWRPRLLFDVNSFRDLFGCSSYVLSFNMVIYLARNFDNLIIGKFLGAATLGLYSMAYTLMMKPIQQISWAITGVLFPAFSSIQDDIPRIRHAYLKVIRTISLVTFPMMMGLMMLSREVILVVMGPKWEGVVPPLQVLCFVGALQSVNTTTGSIFTSLRKVDLQFRVGIITSIGHIIGFMVGINWGIMGLVKAYLMTNVIFFFYSHYFANKIIQLPMKEFLYVMRLPAFNTVIMIIFISIWRYIDNAYLNATMIWYLISSVSIGFTTYMVCTMLFMDESEANEIKHILMQKLKPAKANVD